MAKKPTKIEYQISGVVIIVLGVVLGLFIQMNAPDKIRNSGINELFRQMELLYYVGFGFVVLLLLGGIANFVKGLKE